MPNEKASMAGYTFFGCDLTLFGKNGAVLHTSIDGLAEDNFSRGKVMLLPVVSNSLKINISNVVHGMNTNLLIIPIDLTANLDSNYTSISLNIPKGEYVSSSASTGTLSNIITDGKGTFSADYFSIDGFENSIIYLTYKLDGILPDKPIQYTLVYKNFSNKDDYKETSSFNPLELYKDCLYHWAKDDIIKSIENSVFWWLDDDLLEPDKPITRAEFIASLAKICNHTVPSSIARFADVLPSAWYSDTVNWAVEEKIINGVGDSKFEPNNSITREEIAVALKRAFDYKNITLNTQSYKEFADDYLVSSWAKNGVMAMQTSGLMNGVSENKFMPKRLVTRAEAIVLLQRFGNYIH